MQCFFPEKFFHINKEEQVLNWVQSCLGLLPAWLCCPGKAHWLKMRAASRYVWLKWAGVG